MAGTQDAHFVELKATRVLRKHDEPSFRQNLLSIILYTPVVESSPLKGRKGRRWFHAASREQRSRTDTSGERSEEGGW